MNLRTSALLIGLLCLGGCLREPEVSFCPPNSTESECLEDGAAPDTDAAPNPEADGGPSPAEAGLADAAMSSDSAPTRDDAATNDDAAPARDALIMDAEVEPEVDAEADAEVDAEVDAMPPPPCMPVPETCNGVDDDCDEAVDEDILRGRPAQGGRIIPEGVFGARFAVSGDRALVIWINYYETVLTGRPVNLYGRILNLANGDVSDEIQYTNFRAGERGVHGGYDVVADGDSGFVVANAERVPGVVAPEYDGISMFQVNPDGVRQPAFTAPDIGGSTQYVRLTGEEGDFTVIYAGRNRLHAVKIQDQNHNLIQLADTEASGFDVIQARQGGVVRPVIAWAVDGSRNDQIPGLFLTTLGVQGDIALQTHHIRGSAMEPDLFPVGEHVGLTWVTVSQGQYTTYFDLLDPRTLQSLLGRPMSVHRNQDLITGSPVGVLLPTPDGAPRTVVLSWLVSSRPGLEGDPSQDQDVMRVLLTEALDASWTPGEARVVRPSDSNIVSHGLAASEGRIVSLSVDNGFGGPMCNGLCGTPIATECARVPTDLEIAECRPECAREALFLPAFLGCIGSLDCDAPDLNDRADACEERGEELAREPPPFDSVGVHVHVAEACVAP